MLQNILYVSAALLIFTFGAHCQQALPRDRIQPVTPANSASTAMQPASTHISGIAPTIRPLRVFTIANH
jgi:hypothetical protein